MYLQRIRNYVIFIALGSLSKADNLFDYDLYQNVLNPEMCKRHLENMWDFEFFDASFRVPQGILTGNYVSLGNYHQCLAINQEHPDTNIEGKYCLIEAQITTSPTMRLPSLGGISSTENVTWTELTLNWPDDKLQYKDFYSDISLVAGVMPRTSSIPSFTLAVCVPRACAVSAVLEPYAQHPAVGFNYTERYCRLPDDKPLVGADYAAIVIFATIGVLTIISTAYELHHIFILKKDVSEASAWLRVCSVYTNTARLATFDGPRATDCLDGIRALSIIWIIIGHTFVVYFFFYLINFSEMEEWLYTWRALWILSSGIAVDTFFTLSGLLLVYSVVRKMNQKSLLRNLHLFYLNRVLRIVPLLAAAVLLQASLLHRVADGPTWHYMAEQVGFCRQRWWSALLFVQNILNSREMCLPHTWYLSADMQLHVISPLVLFWVLGSRRSAWTGLAASILASIAATFAFCFIYDFVPRAFQPGTTLDQMHEYTVFYYHNTVTRSPPFFIGMMFGYVLHVYRNQKVNLSKWTVAVMYCVAILISFYGYYIEYPNSQDDWESQVATNFNTSLKRSCWSLALCWLIFACVHGYGGPVNWFLSLRLWKPVARISYALYLFHYPLQFAGVGAAVAPFYFSMEALFQRFSSDLLYSVLLSVCACVLIDEPVATLQNLLLGGASKRPKRNEDGNASVPVIEVQDSSPKDHNTLALTAKL